MGWSNVNRPDFNQYVSRTFLAFALIGVSNAVLLRISCAANYLIIPYSQPVVLLLENCPSAIAKILLPFVIERIPRNVRLLLIAATWLIIKVVVSATPPNVLPPVRILTTVLAAVSSAATEIFCLDLIQQYGRIGLIAWAVGTSLGHIANATWPLVLTSYAGMTLREEVRYMHHLVAIMMLAYFMVLPQSSPIVSQGELNMDKAAAGGYDVRTSLMGTVPTVQHKGLGKVKRNSRAILALLRQAAPILFLVTVAQALVSPGSALALDGSSFSSLLSWTSALALALHVGNLTARLSAISLRLGSHRVVLILLVWTVALLVADSIFFLGNSWVVLGVALCSGLLGGAVYVEVFDTALRKVPGESHALLSIGIISAAEVAGGLLGGIVGYFWETLVCNITTDEERFCHRSEV
ncbi:hypothetical protein CGLO_18039 [Colletotrichum gloeosporioides Cg-14]|uniref:Protein BTN n=1 Tax=Colletotrichum gloeosporioides (strain Cg-14) TaxID=1237896 RepID=T0JV92_COLGC|nr:hypothetical protein CGLO_18039 [Colletotrichum gloeosporioides Cg-14]